MERRRDKITRIIKEGVIRLVWLRLGFCTRNFFDNFVELRDRLSDDGCGWWYRDAKTVACKHGRYSKRDAICRTICAETLVSRISEGYSSAPHEAGGKFWPSCGNPLSSIRLVLTLVSVLRSAVKGLIARNLMEWAPKYRLLPSSLVKVCGSGGAWLGQQTTGCWKTLCMQF